MGTRHMIGVVKDGIPRIAQYGQWDGYPSGQGISVLKFLQSNKLESLKKNIGKCFFLTESEYKALWLNEFGIDIDVEHFVKSETSEKFHKAYPQFSRNMGSDILHFVADSTKEEIALLDNYNFAYDSLFCEWAYVIDFDKNTFEVYEGFNKTPLSEDERFCQDKPKERAEGVENEYYPVKLKAEFKLSKLPTEDEFLKICEPEEEEEAS